MNLYFANTLSFGKEDGVYLVADNVGSWYSDPWDDFGYKVTFKVYVIDSGEEKRNLGEIKLLVNGVKTTSKYLIDKGVDVVVK